jgi:hypothetical protein
MHVHARAASNSSENCQCILLRDDGLGACEDRDATFHLSDVFSIVLVEGSGTTFHFSYLTSFG